MNTMTGPSRGIEAAPGRGDLAMASAIENESAVAQLDSRLAAAFSEVTIDREMIDEPTSEWTIYDDREDLSSFEGKSWTQLDAELLIKHASLVIWAGDALWKATLPAYLRYLLHERARFTDVPYHVAGQLRRREAASLNARLQRRWQDLSPEQRSTVRDVIGYLATVPLIDDVMSLAVTTLDSL